MENTNTSISSSVIETILKNNYIFNNISLTSKPWVIKASSKLNMAIGWTYGMSKVKVRLSISLTDTLMLEAILLPFKEQT